MGEVANIPQRENQVMWSPKLFNTNMDRFRKLISEKYETLENYWDLYQWSVKHYSEFWEEIWHFAKIIHSKPYVEIVDNAKRIEDVPEWFHGTLLNYSENLLQYRDDHIALYVTGEAHKEPTSVTFAELYDQVSLYSSALKKVGIQKGDRVVGYLPNCEETVEAMLAAASLGAVWSSTSPDFGVTAVLDRFQQIQPKVIFSVDRVMYNGKTYDHLEKLQQVVAGLPVLEVVVIIPFNEDSLLRDISVISKSCFLPHILKEAREPDGRIPPLEFVQVPFNHPLFILYSSGTTGAPKCMVHSVGGTLIKHLKEHLLHGNMTRSDVIMYYTTTGWMMWNWLVTSLAIGATVVLYDGSPFIPHSAAIWDLVDKLGITILGTGAKWLALCEDKSLKPRETHSLHSLHTILSTGSPLKPLTFDYVYRDIKSDILLGSITGGSDIIACFAGQNPTLNVYRGEIQCRMLGMAVECWNDCGTPVLGHKGELVCTKPFPCMPTHFWNDTNGKKYKKAYFNKYAGVWSHGDFCLINPSTGGIVMLGRSDGILNPNGVRIGTAEIYNIVEAFKEVQDSVCVSQYNKENEERAILFLRMAQGYSISEDLISRIQVAIRNELSARHVPAIILETKDIPYTISGKKVEVAVKKIIAGEDVTNRDSLANPESLNFYFNIPQLQGF